MVSAAMELRTRACYRIYANRFAIVTITSKWTSTASANLSTVFSRSIRNRSVGTTRTSSSTMSPAASVESRSQPARAVSRPTRCSRPILALATKRNSRGNVERQASPSSSPSSSRSASRRWPAGGCTATGKASSDKFGSGSRTAWIATRPGSSTLSWPCRRWSRLSARCLFCWAASGAAQAQRSTGLETGTVVVGTAGCREAASEGSRPEIASPEAEATTPLWTKTKASFSATIATRRCERMKIFPFLLSPHIRRRSGGWLKSDVFTNTKRRTGEGYGLGKTFLL